MNFEAYLTSKKIDSEAFQKAEPSVWESWKVEFEQMHPNSFTGQKLYLINPVRKKYLLKAVVAPPTPVAVESTPVVTTTTSPAKSKPMMRPKPKIG